MERYFMGIANIDPVPKSRPRLGRGGRTYTPQKTASFERSLKTLLKMQKGSEAPFTGPLIVTIRIAIRRPQSVSLKKRPYPTSRPDLDNYVKGVLDAANGVLWEDDSQIIRLVAAKEYYKAGQITIVVAKFDPESDK